MSTDWDIARRGIALGDVRQRAREIWQRQGRPEGLAEDHWLQAKWELLGEAGAGGSSGAGQLGE
jgi:hypothetical protein